MITLSHFTSNDFFEVLFKDYLKDYCASTLWIITIVENII